jgi:hypothetical protein
MKSFNEYLQEHEKCCKEKHYRSPGNLADSKLECIKKILLSINTKEQFKSFFQKRLLHSIRYSDDIDKIKYFYNFTITESNENRFEIPICETNEENKRMEWLYDDDELYLLNKDIEDIIRDANYYFKFNFVKYMLDNLTIKLKPSTFRDMIIFMTYASLGYTNCYYGLFGKPGNPSIYKYFFEKEFWKYAKGDPEINKKKMIDNFISYLPDFHRTDTIYTLDMRDEWWKEFMRLYCPEIADKIDWTLFKTPEVDLKIKLYGTS